MARRGAKRAAVAVGHSLIVIACAILARGTTSTDLGVSYFDERERDQTSAAGSIGNCGTSIAVKAVVPCVVAERPTLETPDAARIPETR